MCSTTSATMPTSSSTWAASVPMDLTEAITAAVGSQPVPQLPPKLVLNAAPQHKEPLQQSQHLPGTQHPHQAVTTISAQPASIDVCRADVPPVRRPTLAEVRAASPPAEQGLQQPLLLQADGPMRQANGSDAALDDIDSLQQQLFLQQSQGPMQQAHAHLPAASSDAAVLAAMSAACKALDLETTQLSQQEQQQLLSQLWSELQARHSAGAADAAGICQVPQQQQAGRRGTGSAHISPGASIHSSSSCCSSEPGLLAAAALSAAAAAASTTPAVAPDSPCSSAQSKALSTCSTSSSKKRVSWGDDVVYQLPADEPAPVLSTLWQHFSQNWATGTGSGVQHWGSRASTTVVVSVSIAAAAACVACLLRQRRSN